MGATTNEELRGKYTERGNPFDEGCRGNCKAFCFGGTSRVLTEGFNVEIMSATEPNVFVVKPKV